MTTSPECMKPQSEQDAIKPEFMCKMHVKYIFAAFYISKRNIVKIKRYRIEDSFTVCSVTLLVAKII